MLCEQPNSRLAVERLICAKFMRGNLSGMRSISMYRLAMHYLRSNARQVDEHPCRLHVVGQVGLRNRIAEDDLRLRDVRHDAV
jgi:hypothetical protein